MPQDSSIVAIRTKKLSQQETDGKCSHLFGLPETQARVAVPAPNSQVSYLPSCKETHRCLVGVVLEFSVGIGWIGRGSGHACGVSRAVDRASDLVEHQCQQSVPPKSKSLCAAY